MVSRRQHQHLAPFTELSSADVGRAGGKGASLGEMTQAGISVPPGFVILTGAFEDFLAATDIGVEIDSILGTVDIAQMHTVEDAAAKIQTLILNSDVPADFQKEILKEFKKLKTEFVAVRSSATAEDSSAAAWAGQLDSFLNTTEQMLIQNVLKCWASLFTPRAVFYRFEKQLHSQKISVAVVVQKMVQSEVSGVAFSVHPVTEDRNQLIIEGSYGLGEAIVSGQVTPDSYVVSKEPREIIDKNVFTQTRGLFRAAGGGNEWRDIPEDEAKQAVLDDAEILKLSEEIIRVERHYGFPVDIEWAREKGEFYIVQSRPITTLSQNSGDVADGVRLDPENYQRLFRVESEGVSLLLSDIFMQHYRGLECLLFTKPGDWISYLPKTVIQQTLEEGLALFSSDKLFKKYKKDFEKYKCDSKKFFEKCAASRELTQSQTEKAFTLAGQLWSHYSKTEFFYTDKAYEESVTSENRTLRGNLRELEDIKNKGREYHNQIVFDKGYLEQIFTILKKQFSLSYSDLENYTIAEVLGLFDGSRVPDKALKERKDVMMINSDGTNIFHVLGSEAKKLWGAFSRVHEGDAILKGVVAHPGYVKGRVRSVPFDYGFNYKRLDKILAEMQEGEILVAETTSPELMPACKKAAAILTNEGGLLSHAAIVSRELDIPCLVGFGNATDLLKTGMEVEVDANKGIVRML